MYIYKYIHQVESLCDDLLRIWCLSELPQKVIELKWSPVAEFFLLGLVKDLM